MPLLRPGSFPRVPSQKKHAEGYWRDTRLVAIASTSQCHPSCHGWQAAMMPLAGQLSRCAHSAMATAPSASASAPSPTEPPAMSTTGHTMPALHRTRIQTYSHTARYTHACTHARAASLLHARQRQAGLRPMGRTHGRRIPCTMRHACMRTATCAPQWTAPSGAPAEGYGPRACPKPCRRHRQRLLACRRHQPAVPPPPPPPPAPRCTSRLWSGCAKHAPARPPPALRRGRR